MMRVEKLELNGFKSFSDRTVFNFHPGITCIVGPNGCGKSNVVDSFKWVLGEQSAKSLRGEKMEEVIFNGSQSKKPKGMAEVALHVTGLGGSENGQPMTVTRRLYRSGDSDYILNKDICRLKDIRDVFLDTGLELKSYSIFEQDRISAILNARPEERRFLIEEVAGVMKYKVRRTEALSKLDSSKRNLQRVTDIIAEVKRQINALDRQVKKAERYRKLMEELRSVELRLAKHEYGSLRGGLEEILGGMEGLREREASERAELSRIENYLETKKIALVDDEKRLDAVMAEMQAVKDEMAGAEREMAVLKTEKENLKDNIIRLRIQDEETARKINEASEKKLEIASSKEALIAETGALKELIGGKLDALGAKESETADRENRLEAIRRDAFRVSEELSGLRNEHVRYATSLENLDNKEKALDGEHSELSVYLEGLSTRIRDGEASIHTLQSEHRLSSEEKGVMEDDIRLRREAIESLKGRIAFGREELVSASSRLESLKEMVHSGVEELKDLKVIAAVSEAIEVPETYERAIEGALGEAVNGLIMAGYDEIKSAVDAVKVRGSGRTAFISSDNGDFKGGRTLPPQAIGWASDLIKIKEGLARPIEKILREVAVVRNLDAALSIKGVVSVTLDGEVVELSGVVIAGRSKGILPLVRQIRELEKETAAKKSELEALSAGLEDTMKALGEKESLHRDISERALAIEKEVSLLRHQAETHSEEVERTSRKLSYLKVEKETLIGEKEALAKLLSEKDTAIASLDEERGRLDGSITALQSEISEVKGDYERMMSESVDLRVRMSSLNEKSGSLDKEEKALEALGEELLGKRDYISGEIADAEAKIKERSVRMAEKEETLKTVALKASELDSKISVERERLRSESEEIHASEKGLRELRGNIEQVSKALSELDVRRAEHALKIANLEGNIKNSYGVELGQIEAGPLTDEDGERLEEIKKKIEDLGPVSLGSIEEYEELKKRYDFMTGQQQDLDLSIAELEEAIKKINSTTRKKLRDAYDAMKEKFSEVFVTLFGGGKAELVLTDENNILDTGLDIVAQPPGKKFQNINLLSGGEKTLTALALLFSCFLIKPTPLCILDEADAALDESNTDKFSKMLRELSSDIQFIVITHNRVTMEAAHYIYGVTMEDPGTSKVISMQLAEA